MSYTRKTFAGVSSDMGVFEFVYNLEIQWIFIKNYTFLKTPYAQQGIQTAYYSIMLCTHPDSSDQLPRSHMTQYCQGYCKFKGTWKTFAGVSSDMGVFEFVYNLEIQWIFITNYTFLKTPHAQQGIQTA